jgi:hypothetical protein
MSGRERVCNAAKGRGPRRRRRPWPIGSGWKRGMKETSGGDRAERRSKQARGVPTVCVKAHGVVIGDDPYSECTHEPARNFPNPLSPEKYVG